MRILVCGAQGRLGRALGCAELPEGTALTGLGRQQLDITDPDAVERALDRDSWSLVINAAAYTAVDRAESERDAAFAVNGTGPAHLARACATRGVPLIHISTDYVFDGTAPDPYPEDHPMAPLSVYGASKAAGEEAVRSLNPDHAIMRVSWLYGGQGGDFVRAIAGAIRAGRHLRVVSDQTGALTHADCVAQAALALGAKMVNEGLERGTYHFAASGAANWHEIAAVILAEMVQLGYKKVPLEAITATEYGLPAVRPANSRLDCGKFDRLVGLPRPHWQTMLVPQLRRILSEQGERI
ncbi:dTDP-4-dehydrorhamnose reductase [Paramagnetospirillum magnetotacticum]|uniref:dTDP-4-dehydrorhamnose reductase n=1 Tax=Paramagnetospirillum magnetotacticum TaxID=188 RepID=UPI000597E4C5|nr:dTDP-4-dehydrorhamnose reductase [Paramagnetospirillum magnetotacticum]